MDTGACPAQLNPRRAEAGFGGRGMNAGRDQPLFWSSLAFSRAPRLVVPDEALASVMRWMVSAVSALSRALIDNWIERALQQGKQDVGLGDYQVRGWRGWHHHMTLVMMAMLFGLEERRLHQQTRSLLSGRDIRALLNQFLPRRDTTLEEVFRQMEVRHRKRQVAIDYAYRKQQVNE